MSRTCFAAKCSLNTTLKSVLHLVPAGWLSTNIMQKTRHRSKVVTATAAKEPVQLEAQCVLVFVVRRNGCCCSLVDNH